MLDSVLGVGSGMVQIGWCVDAAAHRLTGYLADIATWTQLYMAVYRVDGR